MIAGETGGLELAFIAAGVIPFTPFGGMGGMIDARVSLDRLGARASLGVVAGRGGLVFIGPTFPLGGPVSVGDLFTLLIGEGSGVPGSPGPPPPSAIPPF